MFARVETWWWQQEQKQRKTFDGIQEEKRTTTAPFFLYSTAVVPSSSCAPRIFFSPFLPLKNQCCVMKISSAKNPTRQSSQERKSTRKEKKRITRRFTLNNLAKRYQCNELSFILNRCYNVIIYCETCEHVESRHKLQTILHRKESTDNSNIYWPCKFWPQSSE